MTSEKCRKIKQACPECLEVMTACLEHDEYFVCSECGSRMLIDKTHIKYHYESILKKIFGEKPTEPENN